MRTVSANLLTAINRAYSSKPTWKATVYNDKLYTSTPWQNNSVSAMNGKPQSFTYHTGQSLMYAVFNDGGVLKGVKHNGVGITTIVSGVNQYTKPLIRYISGSLYLYYVTSTGYLVRATLDNNFGVTASATSSTNISEPAAALHPVTETGAQYVMLFNIINDAYRIGMATWNGSDWSVVWWDGRIAFPGRLVTDFSELQYTATAMATIDSQSLTFCFVSDYNPSPPSLTDRTSGKVYGVCRNNAIVEWGDVYTAVPADLSYAVVQNGFSYNNTMYLSVTFARRDIVSDDTSERTLFCKSTDGVSWSLAEHDMMTNQLTGAQGYGDASYFYAGVNNVYYRSARPGSQSLAVPFSRIVDFQDQSNTSGASSATLVLANRDEYYNTQNLISEGNKVVVEAGYAAVGSDEYVIWGTYCIDSIGEIYADADRSFQLRLVSEGVYKSSQYVHPVEFEIQGKGYYYKDFREEGGTYTAARGGIYQDRCMVDFWKGEAYTSIQATGSMQLLKNDGVAPIAFTATHNQSFISQDLKEHLNLVDYPTPIMNQSTGLLEVISISVWGWSRSPSGLNNDQIIPFVIRERNGQESEVNTFQNPYPSPDRPPKYYDGTAAGGYPIVFDFLTSSNFQRGDKIKRVGIRFAQGNASKTLIERVMISNVNVVYSDGYGNTPWEHDSANGRYSLHRYGRPFVQFIQEPGNPQFFQAWGEFQADSSSKSTEWGVVGFGYDSQNFMAGILAKDPTTGGLYPAIIQYIDGIRYSWSASSTTINPANKHYIMFEHTYGKINLYTRQSTATAWTLAVSTTLHRTYNDPAAKDAAILHVGYYAMIKPLMMQVVGYKPIDEGSDQKNDGIAILPGYDSTLGSMPSSGTVKIGDTEYTYAAKVTPGSLFGNLVVGPFQALAMKEYSGVTAVDNTCFKYDEAGNVVGFLAADAGYAWEISSSVWNISDPVETFAFRSRHFGTNMANNYLSNNHRTYFSGGFKTITNGLNTRNHSWGEWLFQKQSDVIHIYRFAAAGGDGEESIKAMANHILSAAGATATWADYEATTLAITGGSNTYIRGTNDKSPFGFDIEWTAPSLGITDGNWIAIYYARGFKIGTETGHHLGVRRSGASYYVFALNDSLSVIEEIATGLATEKFRFIFNGNHCTVLEGGAWLHTFFFTDDGGSRSSILAFTAKSGYNPIIRNIKSVELFSEREAVIFSMAASPISALSDVVQERPILYIPKSDGSMLISYYNNLCPIYGPTAYAISATIVLGQVTSKRTEKESASDLITYYSEGIKLYTNLLHLQNRGFKTSMVSMPNISEDEIDFQAALKAKSDWEGKEIYQISLRPDYRIEPGDLIDFSFTLSGTGTTIDLDEIYVQSVSVVAAENIMQLTCRKKADWIMP